MNMHIICVICISNCISIIYYESINYNNLDKFDTIYIENGISSYRTPLILTCSFLCCFSRCLWSWNIRKYAIIMYSQINTGKRPVPGSWYRTTTYE